MIAALQQGWGLGGVSVDYFAAGGGSYHWIARDRDRRWFVTVDDLDHKYFLGRTREAVFEGLSRALETAITLRDEVGLDFVVAPISSLDQLALLRLGARWAVAVYPFIEGQVGRFGDRPDKARAQLFARLHGVPVAAVPRIRPKLDLLPARASLQRALEELRTPWMGGPFSEPARARLTHHAAHIRRLLEHFDELSDVVGAGKPVVTHGEPHGGNVIRAGDRLFLIDWDTVALAPPERDLWFFEDGDQDAIALYRLRWRLDDISAFLEVLRSPHVRNADTEKAWAALVESMTLTP